MSAIADYAALKSAVQVWAARPDSVFGNQVPIFVEMAEARIFDGADGHGDSLYTPPLRSKVMETQATITMKAGVGTLPADFLDAVKLFVTDGTRGIGNVPPERFAERIANTTGGLPEVFTVDAGAIKVCPALTGSLDLTYYQRPAGISSTNTSNAVLLEHGPIYLTACLFEAFSFLRQGEVAGGHLQRLRSLIGAANQAALARNAIGPISSRPRRVIGG